VSHEIRNPLSAIIQTAEGLVTLVGDGAGDLSRKKQAVVDAGKTVLLCAQHQKRIVDDILTLSKLDSNLLTINPERVTPRALAENVIKMLEADLWSGQIKTTITVDPSYESHSITDVLLDDGRVTQILLNLIANAIKFTKDSNNKCINVRLGASRNRPSIYGSDDITYIAPRSMSYYVPKVSHQQAVSTPNDRDVYLIFDIEDTGPGLGAEEMKTLFQRFSQASTKTYRYVDLDRVVIVHSSPVSYVQLLM
jgi:signal transduction histidine kinase